MTTAEKLDTSKSLEALRSSFDRTEGLSEDIVLIRVRLGSLGKVLVRFRAEIEEGFIKSLSMIEYSQSLMLDRVTRVGGTL